MTMTAAAISAAGRATPPLNLIVAALGLTQILGYGTVYYSFSILAAGIEQDFGISASQYYGALSASLLAAGLLAAQAGRLMDRHGAATLMVPGSIAVAIALAAVALATTRPVFFAALIVLQLASAFVLYNAAFASLVQIAAADARRRIMHLTLIAGFASSLFWPLTKTLQTGLTWREIFLLYAALNLVLCAPIHHWLARFHRPVAPLAASAVAADAPDAVPGEIAPERRPRALLLVALGFALASFLTEGLLYQMVPVLEAVGTGGASVAIAALFGPAQVLIRFVNLTAGSARHPMNITLLCAAFLPIATATLAIAAPHPAGAVLCVLLFGFGSGLKSIVQGTLPLALFGSTGYATLIGRLAAVRFVFGAMAPVVVAMLIEHTGPVAALGLLTVAGVLAMVAFVAVGRLRQTDTEKPVA